MTNIHAIRTTVGRNIKKFREDAHLTQEALAEKLGFSTSHIANIEGGKTGISDEILANICNLFHKKPAEIYNEPDLTFEYDRAIKLNVEDSVNSTMNDMAKVLAEKIFEKISDRNTLEGYTERRNERRR